MTEAERSALDGPAAASRFVARYVTGEATELRSCGRAIGVWMAGAFNSAGLGEVKSVALEWSTVEDRAFWSRLRLVGSSLAVLLLLVIAYLVSDARWVLLPFALGFGALFLTYLAGAASAMRRGARARFLFFEASDLLRGP